MRWPYPSTRRPRRSGTSAGPTGSCGRPTWWSVPSATGRDPPTGCVPTAVSIEDGRSSRRRSEAPAPGGRHAPGKVRERSREQGRRPGPFTGRWTGGSWTRRTGAGGRGKESLAGGGASRIRAEVSSMNGTYWLDRRLAVGARGRDAGSHHQRGWTAWLPSHRWFARCRHDGASAPPQESAPAESIAPAEPARRPGPGAAAGGRSCPLRVQRAFCIDPTHANGLSRSRGRGKAAVEAAHPARYFPPVGHSRLSPSLDRNPRLPSPEERTACGSTGAVSPRRRAAGGPYPAAVTGGAARMPLGTATVRGAACVEGRGPRRGSRRTRCRAGGRLGRDGAPGLPHGAGRSRRDGRWWPVGPAGTADGPAAGGE